MENYLISLKNIYRLLTLSDYPVYSNNIFSKKNRRGLTLVRFWRDILPYSWRNTMYGKRIWRTEGSKNRLHSELCNRNDHFLYYREYIEEILHTDLPGTILEQIENYRVFLLKREYDHDILTRKIEVFLEKAAEKDPLFSEEMVSFFERGWDSGQNGPDAVSMDAWLLTFLTLHAIAGEAMNGGELKKLRNRGDVMPEKLFRKEKESNDVPKEPCRLLTNTHCELWRPALEKDSFFGRETELFDLSEMGAQGGHYLLSGMGGIGKTELLRQHLGQTLRNHTYALLATVQFEESLKDSFLRSFSGLKGTSSEERFHECIWLLSENDKTILYIDNLDTEKLTEEDVESLKTLPCTVFVSSRQRKLDGFQTYEVDPIDYRSATLIFRRNYGQALSAKERNRLEAAFTQSRLQHPLTLRLLGQAARSRRWTIEELMEQMERNAWKITWKSENTQIRLEEVFRRLYNTASLTEAEKRIVSLVALLPYQTYPANKIFRYLNMEEEEGTAYLSRLNDMGFLDLHSGGYSMHPVIAESTLNRNPLEEDYRIFWDKSGEILDLFLEEKEKGKDVFILKEDPTAAERVLPVSSEELVEEAWLCFSAACHIRGKISERLALLCETACYILLRYHYEGRSAVLNLEKIVDRCEAPTEKIRTFLLLNQSIFGASTETAQLEDILENQKKERTMPPWMYYELYFGLFAQYIQDGKYSRIEAMAKEVLTFPIAPEFEKKIRIGGTFYLANAFLFQSRAKECIQSFQNVIEMAKGDMESFGEYAITSYLKLAWLYVQLQDIRSAEQYFCEAEKMIPDYGSLEYQIQFLDIKGGLAELKKDWDTALSARLEIQKLAERMAGKDSGIYLDTTAVLAKLYGWMKQYPEAHRQYEIARRTAGKLSLGGGSLMVILNNEAAAYLDEGEAEMAYPLLLEAWELAPDVGEVALAEIGFNLSRVFRARGDVEKELAYLQKCVPVFESSYGPEHSKTVRSRARLQELQQIHPPEVL